MLIVNWNGPRLDIDDTYLVFANAVLMMALTILLLVSADSRRLRIRRVARLEEKAANVIQHLDSIFQTRTGVSIQMLKQDGRPEELALTVQQSSDFLRFLIDETRAIFEDYTNNPCAASIKLLVPSEEKAPLVKTYIRDKKSEIHRSKLYPGDGQYPYFEHSPFVDIVSGRAEGDYFINNDLQAAARRGEYRNGNKYWQKLYNATLIVPIKDPGTLSADNLLGFLCVDSLTAKFDERVCVYTARIISNTIFYVIYSLSMLEARSPSEPNAYEKKRIADA